MTLTNACFFTRLSQVRPNSLYQVLYWLTITERMILIIIVSVVVDRVRVDTTLTLACLEQLEVTHVTL